MLDSVHRNVAWLCCAAVQRFLRFIHIALSYAAIATAASTAISATIVTTATRTAPKQRRQRQRACHARIDLTFIQLALGRLLRFAFIFLSSVSICFVIQAIFFTLMYAHTQNKLPYR